MSGMDDGPAGLRHMMDQRAEYLNVPRVGDPDNSCFPLFQLNIASAAHPGHGEWYWYMAGSCMANNSTSATTLDASLGKYGTIHPDCGDTACSVTGMTSLSKPHPDVDNDLFFIQDYGVAIVFSEFDVMYFCGLHLHGGCQPIYKPTRTSDEEYVRITLIAYPPSKFFDIPSSSAFASLPGAPRVLKLYGEMKDYV
jgi:hypothetical protein